MKSNISFIEGIGIAILISVTGSIFFIAMSSLISGGILFKVLVSFVSSAYLFYLLIRSHEKSGKITVLITWLSSLVICFIAIDSALLYLVTHIVAIWLTRSLFYYNSVLSSLVDLLLSASSLIAAIITWQLTHNLILSLWCLFLIQATYIYIPKQFSKPNTTHNTISDIEHNFEQAHKSAEIAIRKLSTL